MMAQRKAARALVTSIAAALAVASAGPAGADVVFGMKERCPTGSLGMVSHTGPWCQAVGCKVDDECGDFFERDHSDNSVKAPKEPMACVEYGVCVKTESVQQRGGWSGGKTIIKEIAVGACDPAGSCPSGATCSREKRCIPSRLASAGGPAATGATPEAGAPPPAPTSTPPDAGSPASGPAEEVPPATSCGRCAAGGGLGAATAGLVAWTLALAALGARRSRRRTRK
jgi:hypothetical protein